MIAKSLISLEKEEEDDEDFLVVLEESEKIVHALENILKIAGKILRSDSEHKKLLEKKTSANNKEWYLAFKQ